MFAITTIKLILWYQGTQAGGGRGCIHIIFTVDGRIELLDIECGCLNHRKERNGCGAPPVMIHQLSGSSCGVSCCCPVQLGKTETCTVHLGQQGTAATFCGYDMTTEVWMCKAIS